MDDIERLARVLAASTGQDPDALVTRYTPYQLFDGSYVVRPEELIPYWSKFYGYAATVVAELQARPLGQEPREEPRNEEAPARNSMHLVFSDGGASDPVGFDAGSLTSSDWGPDEPLAQPAERPWPWAERNGLR